MAVHFGVPPFFMLMRTRLSEQTKPNGPGD